MQRPNYCIWATLLDSFDYYLRSDGEQDWKGFIDILNRVEKPRTYEQARGILFNDWVDGKIDSTEDELRYYNLQKSRPIVDEINEILQGTLRQVYLETSFNIEDNKVKLYGYADAISPLMIFDIKTTHAYSEPRYYLKYQHLAYLECLRDSGTHDFTYLITDFRDIFEERITYSKQERDRLMVHVQRLVEFIEDNLTFITNQKLLGVI